MVTVPAAELHTTYERIARDLGATESDAAAFADCFLRADLRGRDTQGIACLPLVLEAYRAGGVDFGAVPEVVQEGPALAVLDGHPGPGQVVATHGMRLTIAKAHAAGMGNVWLRNTNDVAMASNYTLQAAAAGCAGASYSSSTVQPMRAAAA